MRTINLLNSGWWESDSSFRLERRWGREFEHPDRPLRIECAFESHERRHISLHDPHIGVGWRLAKHRSAGSGDPTDLNLELEASGFVYRAAEREACFVFAGHVEVHQPRLRSGGDVREL